MSVLCFLLLKITRFILKSTVSSIVQIVSWNEACSNQLREKQYYKKIC